MLSVVRMVLAMYLVLALADAQNVHDFEVEEEWTGNYIVLGTTGSGKTTLIKYMTHRKLSDHSKGAEHRNSIGSQTTESKLYKTAKIKIDGVSVSLKLRDTVGFGAKDMATKNILKETFLSVVTDFEKIRGCILVHKCERFREGGYKDLEQIKQMFASMGLLFDKHLLIVITHSGHLNDATKQNYSDELKEKVMPEIPVERIIHVNFAKIEELNDHHRQFYTDTAHSEFHKLMTKLQEFEDEIAPVAEEIKAFVDNTYDKNLKKKSKDEVAQPSRWSSWSPFSSESSEL